MTFCGRGSQVSRFIRLAVGLSLSASAFAIAITSASARSEWRPVRHHHAHYASRHYHAVASSAGISADPAFSAIVVDENTGREIFGVNENGLRHPASITKVMTLYLLFEQLDKGNMTLQTRIPISEHAAAQEPSKLGIAAGNTISVEDAIKAVVTRSANDIAVAIAEAIGHDKSTFAEMMTRKAHALGMSRTIYRNASGLPNDEQITTARDLTVLARSLEERFPKYFRYFSTHEFEYAGEIIGNHNHLLGRIDGVDEIKTGYTRASGFNLLTSVHRDGRSLVAVVMGGHTAAARDHVMETLIEDHIAEASNHGHTATMIADNESPLPPVAPAQIHAAPQIVPVDAPAPPARNAGADMGEGDSDEDAAPTNAPNPAPVAKPVAHGEKTRPASPRRLSAPRARQARETRRGRSSPTRLGQRPRRRRPSQRTRPSPYPRRGRMNRPAPPGRTGPGGGDGRLIGPEGRGVVGMGMNVRGEEEFCRVGGCAIRPGPFLASATRQRRCRICGGGRDPAAALRRGAGF